MKSILGLFLASVLSVSSYDILCFYHIPSMSHHHLAKGIILPLLKAGHRNMAIPKLYSSANFHSNRFSSFYVMLLQKEVCKTFKSFAYAQLNHVSNSNHVYILSNVLVTWVTPYPDKTPNNSNLTIIDVSSVKKFSTSINSKLSSFSGIKELTRNVSLATFHHPELRSALVKNQYDAVITEWFLSDMEAGYAAIQQVPWILFSSTFYHPHLEFLIDTTRSIPVYPMMMLDSPTPMNFLQRIKNTLLYLFLKFDSWRESFRTESLYKTLFAPLAKARGMTLPPFSEALHNISILLINSHPSYTFPHVLPPNAVEIGGFHIEDAQKLPEDLQKLLDGFQQGFIYFSMGSLFRTSALPLQTRKDLISTLGQLPLPVLWKYEEDIDNLPTNLYIRKWFPQSGVLEHPNIKLFISHCGLLSSLEALHHGVPMLAVPVFGDQPRNADSAVREGRAVKVTLDDNLATHIAEGLQDMLHNDKYYKRAKYLSTLFRSRPIAADALAVHYIELAVKTGGARHLRSKAQLYEWYQLWMLDQLALFVVLIYLLYKIFRLICTFVKKLLKKKQKTS